MTHKELFKKFMQLIRNNKIQIVVGGYTLSPRDQDLATDDEILKELIEIAEDFNRL